MTPEEREMLLEMPVVRELVREAENAAIERCAVAVAPKSRLIGAEAFTIQTNLAAALRRLKSG